MAIIVGIKTVVASAPGCLGWWWLDASWAHAHTHTGARTHARTHARAIEEIVAGQGHLHEEP